MSSKTMFVLNEKIDPESIPAITEGLIDPELTDSGFEADLTELDYEIEKIFRSDPKKTTRYDVVCAESVHRTFRHLPYRLLLSEGFWNWLCLCRLDRFVWYRWFNGDKSSFGTSKNSTKNRFLCRRSLQGRHHNALSRLYFTADALFSEADDYKLVRSVFENQDRHTAIFDREIGLSKTVAKVLAKHVRKMSGKKTQSEIKRFNHLASSFAVEVMDEKTILEILR